MKEGRVLYSPWIALQTTALILNWKMDECPVDFVVTAAVVLRLVCLAAVKK
jgi:hypothetical protein